jgi:membrane protease subunit HflK
MYGNVTKILVDSRQGSNLLYLPLDKIIQQGIGSPPTRQPLQRLCHASTCGKRQSRLAGRRCCRFPNPRPYARSRERDTR